MEQSKLTREEIQSIDTYLKNSDILFIDVRMEMVDHVATAVESDMLENGKSFYDAFKDYMALHKKELLSGYKKLQKKKQRQCFLMLWPYLNKPWNLILLIALLGLLLNFETWFSIVFPFMSYIWGCLLLTMGIYFWSFFPPKKYRFSDLQALWWSLFIVSQVAQLLFQFWSGEPLYKKIYPFLITLFTAAFTVYCIAFVQALIEKKSFYKEKYQSTY